MRDFRKLDVWPRAHRLTLSLYRVTRLFPKEELYGLTSQIRRALSADLEYLVRSVYAELHTEVTGVKRMLAGLLNRLKADSRQPMALQRTDHT